MLWIKNLFGVCIDSNEWCQFDYFSWCEDKNKIECMGCFGGLCWRPDIGVLHEAGKSYLTNNCGCYLFSTSFQWKLNVYSGHRHVVSIRQFPIAHQHAVFLRLWSEITSEINYLHICQKHNIFSKYTKKKSSSPDFFLIECNMLSMF